MFAGHRVQRLNNPKINDTAFHRPASRGRAIFVSQRHPRPNRVLQDQFQTDTQKDEPLCQHVNTKVTQKHKRLFLNGSLKLDAPSDLHVWKETKKHMGVKSTAGCSVSYQCPL